MSLKTRKNTEKIRSYALRVAEQHPDQVSSRVRERFGLSRGAVSRHLRTLVQEGLLEARGKTKARRYVVPPLKAVCEKLEIKPGLAEDRVWREFVAPVLKDKSPVSYVPSVADNVIDICHYGFTEMFNNAIDHSESDVVIVGVERRPFSVHLEVTDDGIGIFAKIQQAFDLEDPRHALLELSKGKLTTDASNHTGEGIFFTSRMFDDFSIHSGLLYFTRENREDDWLIDAQEKDELSGTCVRMAIAVDAKRTSEQVFNEYTSELIDHGFTRTHVALKLLRYEGERLVSRSQAKRLVARFESFREVVLDFQDVMEIGRAFADELFRVYASAHPTVSLIPVNTTSQIDAMIQRVRNGAL